MIGLMVRKYAKKRHRPVIWLTGLPSSGKTAIAKELQKELKRMKIPVKHLDGDEFRKKYTNHLGFSKRDRNMNIKRAALMAKKFADRGFFVIASFVSPYQEMREYVRKICPNFIETYIKCSRELCIQRDNKNMYKKALSGKIKNFTGIQDPYEVPQNPEITLITEKKSAAQNARIIVKYMKKNFKLLFPCLLFLDFLGLGQLLLLIP